MKKSLQYFFFLFFLANSAAFLAQNAAPTGEPLSVNFSTSGGFFDAPITIALSAPQGGKIFYTTDGSKPSTKSKLLTNGQIHIASSTVLRTIAVLGEYQSQTFTQTYFIGEPQSQLPIVSVAIAPAILFDPEKGLMQTGSDAKLEQNNMAGANFWSRKEFACNVEIFESDRKLVHNSAAGFRIFGGYSRIFPQKSIVLTTRKKYGKKYFKHKIFGKNDFKKHKYLVLRNGGSDAQGAHFRDELMSELTKNWDIERQDYRPALLYLNGQYWGIYHLREKINGRFLQDHTDIDKDSLDLLEHQRTVRDGSYRQYRKLLKFIEKNDLASPEHFAKVNTMMDISNFIDYQVAQIFCANTDGGGNIRYWRAHRPNARWRWILFDTDWGFGLHNAEAWRHNTLDFFTTPNGPDWPNPPWSTFLLRNLLRNETFRQQFILRMCDRLNSDFSTENVNKKITYFIQTLEPEMPRHLQRWSLSAKEWQRHLAILRKFAEKRPDFLRKNLQETFNLGQSGRIEILPATGGQVLVNRCLRTGDSVFQGIYFMDIPIKLQAQPNFGYHFIGWEGLDASDKIIELHLRANQTLRIRPRFAPLNHPYQDKILFNEICTYNKVTGDWVEILNQTDQTISLEGWSLTDSKNEFSFGNVRLLPKQYLVVCEDTMAFRKLFPNVKNLVGNMGFGFNRAVERLALFAANGAAVDSVLYRVEPLDEPFTIDLLFPYLNNANAQNWQVRRGIGSPGEDNPLYLAQMIATQKDYWTLIGLAIALGLVAMMSLYYRFWK